MNEQIVPDLSAGQSTKGQRPGAVAAPDLANVRRQLQLFAHAIYEPADVVEVRLLRGGEGRSEWYAAERLPDAASHLQHANREAWQVFAGINPRIVRGRRGNSAVPLARCLFADFDHATLDAVRDVLVAAGMPPPTLIITSGHGVHCYWRLSASVDPQRWVEWMKDLAALLGSDAAVTTVDRIMRLPQFFNLKREPVLCAVAECAAAHVYDLADLPIAMRSGTDTPAPVFRFLRLPDAADGARRVGRCRAYLAKCPPAVAGQRGHDTTWHAANMANRFGLSKDEALELMTWYSGAKCSPPWSEKEIRHKVDDAYRRHAGQHGEKLRQDRKPSNPVFAVRQIAGAG